MSHSTRSAQPTGSAVVMKRRVVVGRFAAVGCVPMNSNRAWAIASRGRNPA